MEMICGALGKFNGLERAGQRNAAKGARTRSGQDADTVQPRFAMKE